MVPGRSLSRRRPKRHRREGGFSLIFMSIFILAMAMLMVAVLPDVRNDNARTIDDIDKLNTVEEHMRSFMAFNGRRPCPADGQYSDLGTNSKYFGKEAGSPGICVGNSSPIPNAPLGPDSTGYIVSGVIPTRSIGLSDDYAYDSYGRRFTYVVDTRATRKSLCIAQNGIGENAIGPGGITIKNAADNAIDHVMYAYIQHGPSGYGAWPGDGSPTALSAAQSAARRVNSGSTDKYMQTDAWVDVAGSPPGASTFTPTPSATLYKNSLITPYTTGGKLDTGFSDLVWYRDDLKNTCCLGKACVVDGFVIEGGVGGVAGWAGSSFNTMDVNQDGRPDLLIGAYRYIYGKGYLFVLNGLTKKGYYPAVITAPAYFAGTQGSYIYGSLYSTGFESPIVADFNGDTKPDILAVGASNANASNIGAIVLYDPSESQQNLSYYLDGTGAHGFTIAAGDLDYTPNPPSLAEGDINGDGHPDIVITKPSKNQVFILWNPYPSAWPADTQLTSPDGTHVTEIDGVLVGSGASLAQVKVADINGDGYADIIIGTASTTSKAYVIFGGPTTAPYGAWPASFNVSGLAGYNPASPGANGTNGFTISDSSGSYMSTITIGDFNGDGYKDIVVGVDPYQHHNLLLYGGPGPKTGASSWASSWPATLNVTESTGTVNGKNDGTSGSVFTLNYTVNGSSNSCTVVSDIGDVNGDGIDEMGCIDSTYASVIFGRKTWPGGVTSFTPDGVNGIAFYNSKQAWWGVSMGPVGDINDDGIADFAIGTAAHDQYVYYGTKHWQQHWYKTIYDVNDIYNE